MIDNLFNYEKLTFNYESLRQGEFDYLFLLMLNILCKIKGEDNTSIENELNKNQNNYNIETELLNAIYECITDGKHPTTCKILVELKISEMIASQKLSDREVINVYIIKSMLIVLQCYDVAEFFYVASDFCSNNTMNIVKNCSFYHDQFYSTSYNPFKYYFCSCSTG